MSEWVMAHLGPDIPVHFTAFHPDYKMQDTPPTPPETLFRAWDIARETGLHYPYTGNIHDPVRGSTYCHSCGETLIGRDWFDLSTWNLDAEGTCRSCGTPCAGVFDGAPGTWGRRRQPVRLSPFEKEVAA
jgi:pyruvate formate lyase activating enzyme